MRKHGMEKNTQLNKNYANSKLNKLLLSLQIIVGYILSVTRALCEKKTFFFFSHYVERKNQQESQ